MDKTFGDLCIYISCTLIIGYVICDTIGVPLFKVRFESLKSFSKSDLIEQTFSEKDLNWMIKFNKFFPLYNYGNHSTKRIKQIYYTRIEYINNMYKKLSQISSEEDIDNLTPNEKLNYYYIKSFGGNLNDIYHFGLCYYEGTGTLCNFKNAVLYFKKAAEGNHREAQYYLGTCYHKGYGVKSNYDIALFWLKKAYAQGSEDAKNYLIDLEELK